MQYLLDTDVLVASKRIHYHPEFCQLFWDWIDAGYNRGVFYSVDKVRDELLGGNEKDMLHQWCKRTDFDHFFLSTKAAISKWSDLANWAKQKEFAPAALSKFLSIKSADAWLIAYAATNPGWTIVTNEVSAPDSRKDVKLPDAAAALGVKTMNLNQLLRAHARKNFTYS